MPRALRLLGTISYSVYLLQALVLLALPELSSPLGTAAMWVTATLALGAATYRWVELPTMRLGRRRSTPPAVAPAVLPVPRRAVAAPPCPPGASGARRRLIGVRAAPPAPEGRPP